jgi:methylmalonyl-CoA carboxyltransferase large subunit
MVKTDPYEVTNAVEELRNEIAFLAARLADLEAQNGKPVSRGPAAPASTPTPAPASQGVTEEELLAISAALAAYLGVRVHIRQIRLISSPAWAQQGRAFIQASHRLQK